MATQGELDMINAGNARATTARHMLVDGFDLVLDTRASRGSTLVDARDGTRYLDLFTFFASSPLGMNPPCLADDPAVVTRLGQTACNKPSNSDLVTVEVAEFVDTFMRVLGDPALPHLFLIDGGALAVENALKVAFDWKSRHNEAAGRDPALGTRVLHLEGAFHGRSGYTMSLTNTDPNKTARFPTFDWPRIPAPAVRFPLEAHEAEVAEAEGAAIRAAEAAFASHPHDIACVIAEPIQGEGGDRHLRGTFLRRLQEVAHANDALFVLDEVQTGCGMTGTAWAYQQLDVAPDVVAFGKKLQVCGVMAGGRVDEIDDNAFRVPSRINSTWGGNLTDIVRATYVLRAIEGDGLIADATVKGKFLLDALHDLADRRVEVSNVRGRGLMCAVDLPDTARRDAALAALFADEQVLLLGSGTRSIRFRPALNVTTGELERGVAALDRVLTRATRN
jgi:L-lysine 6-transaminase